MAVRNATIQQHQDIKQAFDKWCSKKGHGVQKFSNEYIFRELAVTFYKSPKTIENIVFNRTATAYLTPAQGNLFSQQ